MKANASSPVSQKTRTGSNFRVYLQKEFERRRSSEPTYSLRRFASDLGEDPSSLSKLLSGKTPLGPRAIKKLGSALLLSSDEIGEFVQYSKAIRSKVASDSIINSNLGFQEIQADEFRIISDWYHFAILELMQLSFFQPRKSWIAKTLGISITEINLAVERLQRVGLLEIGSDGNWKDLTSG